MKSQLLFKLLFASIVLLLGQGTIAQSIACPSEMAKGVEESIDSIHSWHDAITFYKKNAQCLHDGVGYGYDDRLAAMLADPASFRAFWNGTKQAPWFRVTVSKRVQGEAVSLEYSESILRNLKSDCPKSDKAFCRSLRVQIKKLCLACDPSL